MRPLTDVRVLDLSRLLPGPFATLVLADLGATVDKIEDTGGGDYLRHMPPMLGGQSAAFQLLNRGKRSAVLDLKKPEGREACKRLVASYDVLFDQFRPGVLSRLGLGHEELRKHNERLIICCLTGYGQTGPLAHRAGHDLNYLARSGILSAQGPEGGPPQVPGVQLADISGGMWCVIGILAALAERARTGKGTVLDIAMTDGVLGFASTAVAAALAGVAPRAGDDALTGGIAPYNTYLSKDGHAMTLASLEPKFWMAFCAGVGLEARMDALIPGPHQEELKARVGAIFGSKTREEWVAFAAANDCCLEPALDAGSIAEDPLILARRLVFDIPTPRGPLPQFRTPVTPKDESFTPPPLAGEHTRAIFRDAGFSDDEIDALVKAGAAREEQ
ncbi:MAG TPA: CaiB/BaiF CoA-transferase family protein [Polyangiaceae bacterium]|nr:CaiB/BaiF CoA-transferase family protein [Polyangiaceae bacterium]